MLRSLHIKNYVLIDSLDVSFPEGLIIITGQTGAGKSILLGALSLLSGAKADVSAISEGADNCLVEAQWDDGTVASRLVSRSGRSRCYINDEPVPVSELAALCSHRIDIHSQHQSLLLTDKAFQLSILDHFAGTDAQAAVCRETWRRLQDIRSEISELEERMRRSLAEKDYNESQYSQLEAAALKDGELEELEAELDCLSHAEQIREGVASAISLLGGDGDEHPGMSPALKEAARSMSRIAAHLPALGALSERTESARLELDDILSELEGIAGGISVSAERMALVEERLSLLYSLMRKHSCNSVAELVAVRERFSETLFDCTSLEGRLNDLRDEAASVQKEYERTAEVLSAARRKAAPSFAAEISSSLHYLELERSVFEVAVDGTAAGPTGKDTVQFRFSATGTTPAVDVARCASGGEISRIMLCLKSMMARFAGMPTMIFDEIDTGVSGSVADKMGSMICSMGRTMQVFSITHLPQVAAKGDVHYVVSKKVEDGRTVSTLSRVEGEERVLEIARMLSGAELTPEAVANARALINAD